MDEASALRRRAPAAATVKRQAAVAVKCGLQKHSHLPLILGPLA